MPATTATLRQQFAAVKKQQREHRLCNSIVPPELLSDGRGYRTRRQIDRSYTIVTLHRSDGHNHWHSDGSFVTRSLPSSVVASLGRTTTTVVSSSAPVATAASTKAIAISRAEHGLDNIARVLSILRELLSPSLHNKSAQLGLILKQIVSTRARSRSPRHDVSMLRRG